MGAFIARQPNGLLCRFSSVVDCVTDYNMTEEEYIEMCAEKARKEARDVLDHYIKPFEMVDRYFLPKHFRSIIEVTVIIGDVEPQFFRAAHSAHTACDKMRTIRFERFMRYRVAQRNIIAHIRPAPF